MKSQSGFTLIEMVAVIIILAIMAATAMPKFINLSGDARISSLEGMAGAMNTARTMVRSKWTLAASGAALNVDMGGGQYVSVIGQNSPVASSVNLFGVPAATTSGIWAALDNPTGFVSTLIPVNEKINGTAQLAGIAVWPTGVTVSAACYLTYNTSGTVAVFISGSAGTPGANTVGYNLSDSCG